MSSIPHYTPSTTSSPVSLDSDLWTSEVVPHLPADFDAQARALGAFTRRRAIASPSDLLRGLLAYALIASSFQHLGAWGVLASVASLSAPGWHKRLVASRSWLAWLLSELLAGDPPAVCASIVPHPCGNLLLIDATTLSQPGGTGDDWRLHTAYNFTSARISHLTLTDRKSGEHLGHYTLQPQDIVVADGAYGYRKSVAAVRKQHAHLITRIRPSTFPFALADGRVLDVVKALRKRGPTVREWLGWCVDQAGDRYEVRLVAAKLPPEQAARARKRARRNAQKHGRKVQTTTVEVAGWVLVLTTLVATSWTAEEVLKVYRIRWQIEVLFKRLKSVLELGQLRGQMRETLEATILAQMVGWALQAREAEQVRQHLVRLQEAAATWVVSSWSVTTVSVEVLRQQVRGSWGAERVRACVGELTRYLGSAVRDDRTHQESTARAWLERKSNSRLGLCEAA